MSYINKEGVTSFLFLCLLPQEVMVLLELVVVTVQARLIHEIKDILIDYLNLKKQVVGTE